MDKLAAFLTPNILTNLFGLLQLVAVAAGTAGLIPANLSAFFAALFVGLIGYYSNKPATPPQ